MKKKSGITVALPLLYSLVVLFGSCLKDKPPLMEIPLAFSLYFGGSGNEFGNAILYTEKEEIMCFGTESSVTQGGKDFFLVKTDLNGKLIFTKNYGNNAEETGYAIAASGNNFLLAGCAKTSGLPEEKMYLVYIKDNGHIISEHYTDFQGNNSGATCVTGLIDKGFLVGGYCKLPGNGKDFLICRYDENVNLLWSKSYGGLADDQVNSLFADEHGNFLVFGNTLSYGAGNQDFYLLKLNANGDSLWSKTYGTPDYEQAGNLIFNQHSFFLCGHSSGNGHSEHNVYLIKTDLDGNKEWEKNYGGMMHDGAEHGLFDSKRQQVVMAGYTSSHGIGDVDFLLMKVDPFGNLLEMNNYGTSGNNASFSITQTDDSYFLTGYQFDSTNMNSDLMLLKIPN